MRFPFLTSKTEICNDYTCIDDVEVAPAKSMSGFDIFTQPFMSFSSDIYEKFEKHLWYMMYFTNTAFNLPLYNANWSTDVVGNILITIIWFLVWLMQLISGIFVYFLMMFVNLVTSGIIQKIIASSGEWMSSTILGWNSNNSFGIALVGVLTVLAIGIQIMQEGQRPRADVLVKIIAQTTLTALVVVFLAPRAITAGESIDSKVISFLQIAQIDESQQDMPFNVKAKNEIYNLLILQPYLIQNFAVGTLEELQPKLDELGINLSASDFVQKVIVCSDGNDQEKCLEDIYPDIKKNGLFNIVHSESWSSQVGAVPIGLLLMAHRIILSVPFFFIYTVYGMVDFIKWISLIFSAFFLFGMIFKRNPNYFTFFINRIRWAIISWGFSLFLTIFTSLLFNIVSTTMQIVPFFMILVLDIILAGVMYLLWAFKKAFGRMLFRLVGMGMLMTGRAAMVGSYSPRDGANDLKGEINQLTASISEMTATIQQSITNVDNQEQTVESGESHGNETDTLEQPHADHSVGDTADTDEGVDGVDNAEISDESDEIDMTDKEIKSDANSIDVPDTELESQSPLDDESNTIEEIDRMHDDGDSADTLEDNNQIDNTDNESVEGLPKYTSGDLDTLNQVDATQEDITTDELEKDIPPVSSFDKFDNHRTIFDENLPVPKKKKVKDDESI